MGNLSMGGGASMAERTKAAATAAALAIMGGATSANASTVVNLPLSQILSNAGTYSGSFDISALLNDGSTNYKVTSATLDLDGTSDYGTTGYVITGYYSYSYSYSCGSFWSSHTCYAYVSYPNYAAVDGIQDGVQLSAGSDSTWGYDSGFGFPTSYYGSLVAQLLLSSGGLDSLNNTGSLNFSAMASTNTNVRLSSASLSLELEALSPSAVPEPTTWAMMLLGLGAMGLTVRTNRRRASRVALD